ncbi:MAG: hypothetical protein JSR78_11160 [Proteobacteria bacterium]|nr:hypothetical protein [Pseudomonadota bacterium]
MISHLRLVTTTKDAPSEIIRRDVRTAKLGVARRPHEQLALPYLDSFTVVLAHVESLSHLKKFSAALDWIGPKWIIDVRSTPRLDVLGGSRSHAFHMFEMRRINYVDLFGQLGIGSDRSYKARPSAWMELFGQIVKESAAPNGPFLLLFDNDDLLSSARASLPSKLQSIFHHSISVTEMAEQSFGDDQLT